MGFKEDNKYKTQKQTCRFCRYSDLAYLEDAFESGATLTCTLIPANENNVVHYSNVCNKFELSLSEMEDK